MAALGTSQVSMDVWHSQLAASVATVAAQLHRLGGIIEDLRACDSAIGSWCRQRSLEVPMCFATHG